MSGYWRIMRVDHWSKNLLVLPGLLVAIALTPVPVSGALLPTLLLGFLAVGLVSSSNYVLNEVLDARSDLAHPTKRLRPVPAGQVDHRLAVAQWLVLGVAGIGLGFLLSRPIAIILLVLWTAGTMYNLEPVRTKDIPYLDVLSEAFNNPLRLLLGWSLAGAPASLMPLSLVLSYWMIGCYFMGLKRYAELRHMRAVMELARYRRVFAFYSEPGLLASTMFYASAAMLCLGVFIARYRLELILSFPLVAAVMALYLLLAFEPDSRVQTPEELYREPELLIAVALCAAAMTFLLFVDIPALATLLPPAPLPGTR